MNSLRAELYRYLTGKSLLLSFILALLIFSLLTIKNLQKNIITGIQIGTDTYNPYNELATSSLNILTLILPILLGLIIFTNNKLSENHTNWIYGLVHQQQFSYLTYKLICIVITWFCFLSFLLISFLAITYLITIFYPAHFNGFENCYPFLTFWFLKYYLSSLGAIALIYMLNLIIKYKTVFLAIIILMPYIGIFFSTKGIIYPLTYPYFTTFFFSIDRNNYFRLNKVEPNYFNTTFLVTGYEVLSILVFVLSIITFYIFRKSITRHLTKI